MPSSGSRPVLGLVYLSTASGTASVALLMVSLPFRFQQLGYPVNLYGVAAGAYALGSLATESLWGVWAPHIGRRWVNFALGSAVGLIALSIATLSNYLSLTLALVAFGMLVVYPIPLMRWIALTYKGPGTAGQGTGRWGFFFGVGGAFGAAASPFLFVTSGYVSMGFVALGLMMVATVSLTLVPWQAVSIPSRRGDRVSPRRIRQLFTSHFSLCVLAVIFYFVTYSLISNFLQYYSVDLFRGSPADAGLIIGASRGISFASGWALGHAVDRWGAARSGIAGFALVIAGALGTGVSVNLTEMIGATIVLSVGGGWLSASLLPLALAPVSASDQTTAVGVFGSFENFGLVLGPVLIGSAYFSWGPRSVFPIVGAVGIAGLLATLALHRRSSYPKKPVSAHAPPSPVRDLERR
jgi:MFS family permease